MSDTTADPLSVTLARLETLKLDAIRAEWTQRLPTEPPRLQSTELMRRFLAEALQIEANGEDRQLNRRLATLVKDQKAGRSPPTKGRRLGSGAILVREWKGERHQVEVVTGGFRWNGRVHDSLSSVAREITGARWNGPRFFGLREAS